MSRKRWFMTGATAGTLIFMAIAVAYTASPLTMQSGPEAIFAPDATLKTLAGNGVGGEGPAWHPELGLLTSGNGHICRLDHEGKSSIYRKDAGTNGLLFDRKGRLLACEPDLRRVTRTELDGKITVLTDRFEGKRYNSPNDITVDSQGRIYFSDPRYGTARRHGNPRRPRAAPSKASTASIPDGKVTPRHRPRGGAGQRRAGFGRRPLSVRRRQQQRHGRRGPQAVAVRPAQGRHRRSRPARSCCTIGARAEGRTGSSRTQKGRLYVAAGLNKPNPPFEPAEGYQGRHLCARVPKASC